MSLDCFHCGEPIPAGFKAELSIQGEKRAFCCYGCMAVAEMIVSGNMERFYAHRTEMPPKPDEFSASQREELRLYDDEVIQSEFVTQIEGGYETSLSIQGITCAACIWLLEKELQRLPGVETFSINHSSHRAHLRWQQQETPLSEILIKIRELGYKAHPYQHDLANQEAQKERRNNLFRIAVAGIATMQNMMFSVPLYLGIYSGIDAQFLSLFRWVSMLMCTPVVLYAALPFFRAAIRDVQSRHLTMDIPVSIAIGAAYLASCYITMFTEPSIESDVYFDSVSMFTFFLLLGRFIESQTRHRHLNSDADLQQLLPATALLEDDSGEISIPAHKIQVGDHLVVKQGQIAPADGEVISGESRFDESALTGEYLPVNKTSGSQVSGGTANVENTVVIKATATPKQSRVAAIIRLLDQAQGQKPKTALVADRVASYFVAFILLATSLTALYWYFENPAEAFAITLSVLVVTCPCALSLATPTALTSANTALRKKGFLIAKGHALEALKDSTDIIFDKTGTLTEAELAIHHIDMYAGFDQREALKIAAALEAHSSHPIAQVFSPYLESSATSVTTTLGKGLTGQVKGGNYWLGTREFVLPEASGEKQTTTPHPGLSIYLSDGKQLLARFLLSDRIRASAADCIKDLKAMGIRIHILSGDHEFSVRHTALQLGIERFRFGQSPEQKLAYVDELQRQGRHITMVGDGINDLPVISGARLSVAMGAASDVTKLNADAILLNNQLNTLADAFKTAHKTRRIVSENMAWAVGYNLTMLPLAAMGMIPPYFAALGMSLSSLLVVFNSLRLRK